MSIKLNVEFVSQAGNMFKNDCGAAVLASLAGWPIEDILDRANLPLNQELRFHDLYAALRHFQIPFAYDNNLSAETLRAAIDAGNPVIVLLVYGRLPIELRASSFTGRHWTLVTGYDDSGFFVHDPLRTAAEGGHQHWPTEHLIAAMRDVSQGNLPNQGLVIKKQYRMFADPKQPGILERTAATAAVLAQETQRLAEAAERLDKEKAILTIHLDQLYEALGVTGKAGDPEAQGRALHRILHLNLSGKLLYE